MLSRLLTVIYSKKVMTMQCLPTEESILIRHLPRLRLIPMNIFSEADTGYSEQKALMLLQKPVQTVRAL